MAGRRFTVTTCTTAEHLVMINGERIVPGIIRSVARVTNLGCGYMVTRFCVATRATAQHLVMINGSGLIPGHVGIRMTGLAYVRCINMTNGFGVTVAAHFLHQQVMIYKRHG